MATFVSDGMVKAPMEEIAGQAGNDRGGGNDGGVGNDGVTALPGVRVWREMEVSVNQRFA